MHLSKREGRDYLIGFVFVLAMVGVATWLNDYEIILPEIAALTTGTWIYHKSDWVSQPLKIFLAPSGTAVIGFFVNQLPVNYPEKVLLTLLFVLILLKGLRSVLAPSFATGLLPIIVNATHMSFIVAIFAFTLILMAGVLLAGLQKGQPTPEPIQFKHMALFSVATVIWIALVWASGHPQMAGIPPVFVVFFEVLQKPEYAGKVAIKQIIALSGAATFGVVVHVFIASWLLTTLISLPLVFLLLQLLRIKLPAAYAFPPLALVLPAEMFHTLPIAAVLASCLLLGMAYGYKKVAPMVSGFFANRRQVASDQEN